MSSVSKLPSQPVFSPRKTLWTILLGVFLGLVSLIFIVLSMGLVSGTEFAPHACQHRSFYYWEIPFVHLPLTPVIHGKPTHPLDGYLRQNRYWKDRGASRWDLASVSHAGAIKESDPQVLLGYFNSSDEGNSKIWLDWTIKHPESARVLWAYVDLLSRLELYAYVGVLFEQAQQHPELSPFSVAAHDSLIPLLEQGLQVAIVNKNWHQVTCICTAGMQIDPQAEKWWLARSDAFDSLGHPDKAVRDRRGPADGTKK